MTGDLDAILGYVDALKELDTSGGRADDPRRARSTVRCAPTRSAPSLSLEEALANAPRREASFFQVPRIVARAGRRRAGPRARRTSRDRRARRELRVAAIADGVRAGKLRARDVTEAYLDRIARLDGALGCYLLVDADGARRRADAVDAARAGRARPGPAGGRADRDQGHLRHARASRPPAPRRSCAASSALRVDRDAAAGRRGRGRARQAQHGRVRHGLVEREQRARAGAQPLGAGSRARAARRAARRRRSRRRCAPARSAPTPAARSASPPRSAASSA